MDKHVISAPAHSLCGDNTMRVTDEEIQHLIQLQEKWNSKSKKETTKVFLNSYTDDYLWVQILTFQMDDPTKGVMETKTSWNRERKEWED